MMKARRTLHGWRHSTSVLAAIGMLGVLLVAAPAGAAGGGPSGAATAVVANFIEAFNKHNLNAAMALVADNFVEVFPDGNVIAGKADLQSHVASVFAASPHVTMIVDHLIGDDYTAAAQVSIAPDAPKGAPQAAQYAYFFSVVDGKLLAIAVYTRSDQAQKAAGAKP